MSEFDKIIGYRDIKEQMVKICDMVKNREVYKSLGASFPHGIMLVGEPGLGKSLMAECFIKECGVNAYVIKSNREEAELIKEIGEAFVKAKEKTPSIILLDDMDKFANEDERHCDCKAYTTIQAEMDNAKKHEVVVIATVNNRRKLPDSLCRKGRFDYKFRFKMPTEEDNRKLIQHFFSSKKIDPTINYDDISKMMNFSSCAEVESLINGAAVNAAYNRKECIEMSDVVSCVLFDNYNSNNKDIDNNSESFRKTALHEAGHLVASEIILDGSVGLASARYCEDNPLGGFVRRCKKFDNDLDSAIVALAGKAAVEMYYLDEVADGCEKDIDKALMIIKDSISITGSVGLGFVSNLYDELDSYAHNDRIHAVISAELEKLLMRARNILIRNREFLERVAKELEEKEALLASDIERIKNEVKVVRV